MVAPLPEQTSQRPPSIPAPASDGLHLPSLGGPAPPVTDHFHSDGTLALNISQPETEPSTPHKTSLSEPPHDHEDTQMSGRPEVTPEPLDELEVRHIKERLLAMGLIETVNGEETTARGQHVGEREQELTEMILRLAQPCLSSLPAQVVEQSRTISELVQQRDLIVQRQQEEREFWEAERTGWARIVGALTTRRFADGTHRGDVLERDNISLISENRVLKSKLQDQQTRIDSLEGELRMLRPLLLLQPASPVRGTTGLPVPQSTPKARGHRPKDIVEFSDEDLDLHHSKKPHNPNKHATTGDARTEHLLLATRKLGKEKIARLLPTSGIPHLPLPRVGALGVTMPGVRPGFFNTVANPYSVGVPLPTALSSNYTLSNLQSSPALSSPNAVFPAPTPQTPGTATTGPSLAAQIALPSTPSPIKQTPNPNSITPRQVNPYPPSSPSKAPPKSSRSPLHGRGPARPSIPSHRAPPSTPPNPTDGAPSALEHLITASRILGEAPRRVEPSDDSMDGSPLQKRRKIDNGATGPLSSHRSLPTGTSSSAQSSAVGRTMSALDVLAEQAAVVIAQSPRKGPGDVPPDLDEESNPSSDELYVGSSPTSKKSTQPPPSRRKGSQQRIRNAQEDTANDAFDLGANITAANQRAPTHSSSSVESSLRSPIAMPMAPVDDREPSVGSPFPPAQHTGSPSSTAEENSRPSEKQARRATRSSVS